MPIRKFLNKIVENKYFWLHRLYENLLHYVFYRRKIDMKLCDEMIHIIILKNEKREHIC